MQKLTKENFIKARDYIFSNSDDINRAWFRYNFENGDTSAFMDVLAKYQHENGGFGGLVYEYEYNGPTLHDTEHAFRYIFYLKEKPPADHPVIQKMMQYLLKKYIPEIGGWGEEMEPEVNESVHVPWWTYRKHQYPAITDFDERVEKYDPNGDAAHAAFIALYSELVPEKLYQEIIKYPIKNILRYYDENSPYYTVPADEQFGDSPLNSPYNLKCFQMFCGCLKDESLAEQLKSILCQNPTACMELDSENWWKPGDYNHPPCDIVETPISFLYSKVENKVNESLNVLICKQSEDGSWHLPYRFGDNETFDKLQADFEAHLTCLYLTELNRFGRIE
jgi:hypothetical protein